jgi:sulfatase maturation enzyme AslB (radical SAM superfamily)
MKTSELFRAWGKILKGEPPSLSIEITKECPLRCPGCYAYDAGHLGGAVTLRSLVDRKGQALVDGVLDMVDRLKPLHLSLVGGDPLVRYREVEALIPLLIARGVHVQVVTSAFRPMAPKWTRFDKLNVVVSIDGLQPEHDVRRAPATYERVLRNITGQSVTIHCTVTGQMKRPGYLREFLEFWTPRSEIRKVWFSLFTPRWETGCLRSSRPVNVQRPSRTCWNIGKSSRSLICRRGSSSNSLARRKAQRSVSLRLLRKFYLPT